MVRKLTALFAALGLVVLAVGGQDGSEALNKADLQKLQGTWKVIACEVNGSAATEKEIKEIECRIVIKGTDMTWIETGQPKVQATFTINAKASPKHMDIHREKTGKNTALRPGIYKLEGDRLIFACGPKRPTEFTSRGNPENEMITFVREQP